MPPAPAAVPREAVAAFEPLWGGGYYFRHALSQSSNLLLEVEPEAALLVFQCSNYSVEFVVLSHVVSRHQ